LEGKENFWQTSGAMRGEIARMCLDVMGSRAAYAFMRRPNLSLAIGESHGAGGPASGQSIACRSWRVRKSNVWSRKKPLCVAVPVREMVAAGAPLWPRRNTQ